MHQGLVETGWTPVRVGWSGAKERRRVRVDRVMDEGAFASAQSLVGRRYAGIGIKAGTLAFDVDRLQTLSLTDGGDLVGTLTVRVDGEGGLAADALFPEELTKLRAQYANIAEVTRLAVESPVPEKQLLAKLLHVCWLFAHYVKKADLMVFEVHPKHGQIYRRILGATQLGEERMHSVGAPAVLVCLTSEYIAQQIAQFAGRPEIGAQARTIYPYMYGPQEEARIIQEMLADS